MAAAAVESVGTFSFDDPVHGRVDYPPYIEALIKTCEYQRLSNLKQLGASPKFFASATHTRYEHCLGVCHLATKLMQTLERNSEVKIDEMHRKCVTIAALFHDLGHGPFSHMWEQFVRMQNPESEWCHEQSSVLLVGYMFKKYRWVIAEQDKEANETAVRLIQAFIAGDLEVAQEILGAENLYLTEVVNNKFTQIDVDKWDYMLRDSYYLKGNFEILEFQELFDNVRVVRDAEGTSHISYHVKDYEKIENMFKNRANLHIYCYQEPIIRGVEHLILEILKTAEDAGFLLKGKRISELHEDLPQYNFLDDSILNIIRCTEDPRLSTAQNLLERYSSGDFYSLVWMSPTAYNLDILTEKFGDHFVQIQKRIPLACVFLNRHILLHDDDGNRAPVPAERLTKRGAFYEEYLIYSKTHDAELIQAVYDFLTDMKAEN